MLLARHRVSTKLALYSNDLTSVLIMHYPIRDIYGLPGGHIDRNERPDDAMKRELMEELSLSIDTMKHADFFYSKRIILGYTAVAPKDVKIIPTHPQFEYGVWKTKEELQELGISAEFHRFILENWPNS